MKAKNRKLKSLAIALVLTPVLALVAFGAVDGQDGVPASNDEVAATYKAKCAMCHGAKGDKKFDRAKTDEQHLEAIVKGREGAVKMPAYASKMSEEQAKALVVYMRTLGQ